MNDPIDDLLEQLVPRVDEPSEWDDVVARSRPAAGAKWAAALKRRRVGPRAFRLPLALAVIAGSVAALAISSPWRGAPSIVQRASAAIRDPSPQQVLYTHFEVQLSGCCRLLSASNSQLWVQGSSPHRYRAIFPCPIFTEGGGTVGSASLLSYDAATNSLVPLTNERENIATGGFDPVAVIRQALATGQGRIDGTTRIDGKRALRITLTIRDQKGTRGTVVYYVDPTSYEPIEIVYPHLVDLRFPFEPVFGNGIYHASIRVYAFRYLPATSANLKLADIRAEHPTATVC